MKKWTLPILAVVLVLLGAVTLFMSTAVILDLFGIREKEGNYVLFVVFANFACSLLYLPAAYGFYARKRWAVPLLVIAALLLVIAFAGLGLHIYAGGVYETKTIGALVFRLVVTAGLALLGSRALPAVPNRSSSGLFHQL